VLLREHGSVGFSSLRLESARDQFSTAGRFLPAQARLGGSLTAHGAFVNKKTFF